MSQQIDPNSNLNNFLKQWEEANKQYGLDYSYLMSMLAQMLAEAKSGNIQEAFQEAEMAVMPAAMQVQGDTMGQLGATMNISSALEGFTTDAQNEINKILSDPNNTDPKDPDEVARLIKFLTDFYNQINTNPPPPWLDKNTQANLLQAIHSICDTLGSSNGEPSGLNPKWVLYDMQHWAKYPNDSIYPGGETGQQMMQRLQAGMTQWNNTESAQSQGLQAQEQFAANTFNQYLNSCMNIFQSTQQQNQVMIQNQKS